MLGLVIVAVIALALWLLLRRAGLAPAAAYTPDQYSGFVEVSDARVHFSKRGSGPPLVLVHGLGASLYVWRFVTPILEASFTVIAIDLPGFGRSSKALNIGYGLDDQARRAAEALTALGVETAALVGNSMGGAVVLWMAHLWPERFPKIVALAPATNPRLVPPWIELSRYFSPVLRFAVNKKTLRPFIINAVGRPEIVTDEVIDSYLEPFRDRNALSALLLVTAQLLRDPRLPEALRTLPSQVLLMYGEKDLVVPRAVMTELQAILPNVIYLTHPKAGHQPMEDEPEWVANAVIDFLKK